MGTSEVAHSSLKPDSPAGLAEQAEAAIGASRGVASLLFKIAFTSYAIVA
ncbi:hypothetical protein [Rhizobium sp. NFR03]|nr:hypothetical protein [Rhizobium sp. NFR03]